MRNRRTEATRVRDAVGIVYFVNNSSRLMASMIIMATPELATARSAKALKAASTPKRASLTERGMTDTKRRIASVINNASGRIERILGKRMRFYKFFERSTCNHPKLAIAQKQA